MVAIEQDRRLAPRGRLPCDDRGPTALDLEDLDILDIASTQQGGYGLGRCADVTGRCGIGADRRDTDQSLEILSYPRKHLLNGGPDITRHSGAPTESARH